MGRWRPPQAQSSGYITPAGKQQLQAELKALWTRRSGVTQALAAAAAEGDRSENAEYIYRKKELAGIDRRIRYLQKRIPDLQVVASAPTNTEQVFFAAWVDLEDQDGQTHRYRIVGADEIDPTQGWISVDSPLAKALLKKTLDDEVQVHTPGGITTYSILDIQYE